MRAPAIVLLGLLFLAPLPVAAADTVCGDNTPIIRGRPCVSLDPTGPAVAVEHCDTRASSDGTLTRSCTSEAGLRLVGNDTGYYKGSVLLVISLRSLPPQATGCDSAARACQAAASGNFTLQPQPLVTTMAANAGGWSGGCAGRQEGAFAACAWDGPAGSGYAMHQGLPPRHSNAVVADIDRDGRPDVMLVERGGQVQVWTPITGPVGP